MQHLESLNDVVERITGVRQRETVPDEVVRRAEQIELVDITPEALRRRMAHGNVYAAEKVDAALANYFQPGNLTALRELALLWVADEVDVALQRYRTDKHITEVWETRERVVVALTGGPESETVLRRAARIAKRSGAAELLAVHVLRGDGLAGRAGRRRGAAAPARRRRRRVASTPWSAATTCPAALLDFARGANATQLVLGTSRRSRLARRVRRGHRRARGAGLRLDRRAHGHPRRGRPRAAGCPALRSGLSAVAPGARLGARACCCPLAATALGVLLARLIGLSTDVVLFFLATVVVALVGGLGPGAARRGRSAGCCSTSSSPRRSTRCTIAEPRTSSRWSPWCWSPCWSRWWSTGRPGGPSRPRRARTEAALLASFARTVLTRRRSAAPAAGEGAGGLRPALGGAAGARPTAAHWALVRRRPARRRCAGPDEADVDVDVEDDLHLVGSGRALPAADRRLLEAVGGQALLALRSQRAAAEAEAAQAPGRGHRAAHARCSPRSGTTCAPR